MYSLKTWVTFVRIDELQHVETSGNQKKILKINLFCLRKEEYVYFNHHIPVIMLIDLKRNFGIQRSGYKKMLVKFVTNCRVPSINKMFKLLIVLCIMEFTDPWIILLFLGSSRQKIVRYIKENYNVGGNVESVVKMTLKRNVVSGNIIQTKGTGASGSFKLPSVEKKSAPKKKLPSKSAKKPAPKKPKAQGAPAKKKSASKPKKSVKSKKASPAKKTVAKKPAAKKAKKVAKKAK